MKPYTISPKNLFVCADLHYGHNHPVILQQRACQHVQAHDDLIEESLSLLPKGATVIQLGDIAVCPVVRLQALFDRFPRINWIHIRGNHDEALDRVAKRWSRAKDGAILILPAQRVPSNHTFFGDVKMIKVSGQLVWLSHYAHRVWPHKSYGAWHICGHSHGQIREINPGTAIEKCLDLGMENVIAIDPMVTARISSKPWRASMFISWDTVVELFNRAEVQTWTEGVQYKSGDRVKIGSDIATIL